MTGISITFLLSIYLISLIEISNVRTQMVPISPIIDHPVSESTSKKSPQESEKKYRAHINIAQEHLSENNYESDDNHKVKIKDKPLRFKDPSKHASEELLLHILLEQFQLLSEAPDKVEEKLEILENLKHFAHKYENARDLFKSTDALQNVILPSLNSTFPEIRSATCSILASSASNNAIVQRLLVLNPNVLRTLIYLLSDNTVRSKALSSLSAILRNYPDGQLKFIDYGGINEVIKIINLPQTRKKVLEFLNDLLVERNHCDENFISAEKKVAQEDDESLNDIILSLDPCDKNGIYFNSLKQCGWCQVLISLVQNFKTFENEESVLLSSISSSLKLCNFKEVEPLLSQLLSIYVNLEGYEEVEEELKNIIVSISSSNTFTNRKSRVEL